MRLVIQFTRLEGVKRNLGAPDSLWYPQAEELPPWAKIIRELQEGIEIPLDEISVEHGLFHHEGKQIVIYIKDHSAFTDQTYQAFDEDVESRRKVHLCECSTIEQMRRQGRFDRYVATIRSTGDFPIDLTNSKAGKTVEKTLPLLPCRNCLSALNYEQYTELDRSKKNSICYGFDFEKFFEQYSTFFATQPTYRDNNAPPPGYVKDWSSISDRIRERAGWKCNICKVDLSATGNRRYLHVHHKNGVKSDNSPMNLEALCALCHKAEPGHGHLYVNPEAEAAIRQRRGNG